MSDELKPALSAEEWADEIASPSRNLDFGDAKGLSERAIASCVALANYALPDDSPYKITREDVSQLMELAEEPEDFERARWLAPRLAAKLAALLPPDTP